MIDHHIDDIVSPYSRIIQIGNQVGKTIMNVRTLCLAILNLQDATGYEIKKLSIEGCFQHFVEVSFGSIYPALSKLEKDGLVSCRAEAQDGKPDRKVYSITTSGREEFIKLINVLPQPDKFKSEFLLLSINADLARVDILQAAIGAQLSQYQSELEMIDCLLEDTDQPALVWTANYGKTVLQAKMAYMNENKDQLLKLAQNSLTAQAAE
jgi:PadR family transcriptional regulator AphA